MLPERYCRPPFASAHAGSRPHDRVSGHCGKNGSNGVAIASFPARLLQNCINALHCAGHARRAAKIAEPGLRALCAFGGDPADASPSGHCNGQGRDRARFQGRRADCRAGRDRHQGQAILRPCSCHAGPRVRFRLPRQRIRLSPESAFCRSRTLVSAAHGWVAHSRRSNRGFQVTQQFYPPA
jgi:hypothetical protein